MNEIHFNDMTERKNIKKAIKYAEERPKSEEDFESCIEKARRKF